MLSIALPRWKNEYFNQFQKSQSKAYGRIWGEQAKQKFALRDSLSLYERYLISLKQSDQTPDSLDCTPLCG